MDEMTLDQQRALAMASARARMAGPQPEAPKEDDAYTATARQEYSDLKAKGVPVEQGFARRWLQGASFNTADEIMAGMATPIEMAMRKTWSPVEGYRHAKAWQDVSLDEARKNTGALGTAAEIAGGFMTGAGVARAGLTTGRFLAPTAGVLPRSLASAADGAAFGSAAGFMDGNSLEERGKNALVGGAIGGGIGVAAPGVIKVGGSLLSPVISNVRARIDPEGFARSQVARGVMESGVAPRQIADDVVQASLEGQGGYTVADAMGNAGQRMLSTTTRAPGPARTDTLAFLDSRQAGQGRRIANTLAEGFESPQTAAQTEARLTAARDAAADVEYGAVRAGAGRTDVVPAINRIDRTIGTGPGQTLEAANDSIEGALRPFRERLSRVNPDDFEAVQRIRFDMSDAATNARNSGNGNRAREIGNAVRELDAAMEQASSGYRQANRNFAQASTDIGAVQQGRQAATRGRTEDIIPEFQGQSPAGQGAYRAGYVDPLIQQTQGAAFGVNKARPLINDAFQTEASVMAPGNPLMQRRIAREDRMFQTRHASTGNSKTVENFADDAALGIDPTLLGDLVRGNWSGAARTALSAGQNALTGNTPAVRQEVARLLTMRGGNVTPSQMERILQEATDRVRSVQLISSILGRGGSAGLAVAPAAVGHRRN